jgi:hypothetical protein
VSFHDAQAVAYALGLIFMGVTGLFLGLVFGRFLDSERRR